MNNLKYYFPGLSIILIAILIIAVPEILVAFVVFVLMMAGVVALYFGHMLRKSESDAGKSNDWIFNDGHFRRQFERIATFRCRR